MGPCTTPVPGNLTEVHGQNSAKQCQNSANTRNDPAAATADDRVTSKRPKNKPGFHAYPGSWKPVVLQGGHVSGLKSNRP